MNNKFTRSAKPKEVQRTKHFIDASTEPLGRLASRVARLLKGKDKPIITPHVDCGDFVVVYNAGKLQVTGSKVEQKTYFTHSLYPGGDKVLSLKEKMSRDPRKVIYLAVRGMLPRNTLGETMLKKLTIENGEIETKEAKVNG